MAGSVKLASTVTQALAWFNRAPEVLDDDALLEGHTDIMSMSRAELKANLIARDLSTSGGKKALRNRLIKYARNEQEKREAYFASAEAEKRERVKLEESGSVYSVGSNHAGQLGHGDTDPREFFTAIDALKGKNADVVATGIDYAFCVTEESDVYAWGGSGRVALGTREEGKLEEDEVYAARLLDDGRIRWAVPGYVEGLRGEGIVDIACGYQHMAAISDAGDVFVWGQNKQGQLGTGDAKYKDTTEPDMLAPLQGQFITAIHTGHSHTIAVSDELKVYSWGYLNRGKLGLGATERKGAEGPEKYYFPTPTLIPMFQKVNVRQIECSSAHSIALVEGVCQIMTWGSGDGGRLGHGDREDRLVPTYVEALRGESVTQVACGQWHSAAIVDRVPFLGGGVVYTWGSGFCGQLGHELKTVCLEPECVDGLQDHGVAAKFIACGSHHNAVLTHDDELYTWGSNKYGCLGAEIVEEYTPYPQKVYAFDVMMDGVGRGTPRAVSCGREFTLVSCYPYVGPTEEELIEEEIEAIRKAERKAVINAEAALLAKQAAEQADLEAKRLARESEAAKRPLCSKCQICTGFDPNLFKPNICKECSHLKIQHTRPRPEASEAYADGKPKPEEEEVYVGGDGESKDAGTDSPAPMSAAAAASMRRMGMA